MNSFGYPRRTQSQHAGRVGEAFIQQFVTQDLGWIYRPVHQEDDFGIDGYVDVVENSNVTGRSIAVQVKCGESYFQVHPAGGFRYAGSKQHLNLYLNIDLPVILIITRGNGEGYWVEFNIERTTPIASGWMIQIPERNRLSDGTRDDWRMIAGPSQDYSQAVQRFWAESEEIRNSAILAVAIPKEEVETLSMQTITMVIDRLSRNPEFLLSKRSCIEIFFPDYVTDERELHEIPEFRQWIKTSIAVGIPWFYFLNTTPPSPSLTLIYTSGCEVMLLAKTPSGNYLATTPETRKAWIEANFMNLNRFTEEHRIDEGINREISEKVMARYFEAWDLAEREISHLTT